MQFDKRRRTGVESAINEDNKNTPANEFNHPLSKKIDQMEQGLVTIQ